MANKRRTVAIIGLGLFGTVLSRELTRMGDRVLGLDSDEKRVTNLADEIDSAMQVDASDLKALKECGLEACDSVVVSIGENMQANILATMNVQELGFKQVWVKAQSDAHLKILTAIGIQNIVRPEQDFGLRIAQVIHNPRMSEYLALGAGKYVAEIEVPEQLFGTSVGKLKLEQYDLRCLGVFRSGDVLEAELDSIKLIEKDSLLIFGKRPDLRRFADGF
jgi:trk system potassium uptake protein TrkA